MNEKHTTFNIRLVRETDARSLADVIQEAALSNRINNVALKDRVKRIKSCINMCRDNPNTNIFIVEDSGKEIVAYAVVQWHITLFLLGCEGYISELTVRGSNRGCGIGSMLLDSLVEEGKLRNCNRMSLINSRFRDSYKRGFYEKRGWYERKEAANFIYDF